MTDEVMDWDSAYREQGAFEGPPPWNIGEPQPELATLIAAGKVRSDVLDAGCGYAELSLALAADGYTVVGIDLTPTAVAAATKAAEERGLTTASFVQADITEFAAYPAGSAGRFSTVIDSTLFHSLPVDSRDRYLSSVHRAAAPGASYYVLVFAKGAFPAELEVKPNEVDEDELRAAVSKYWKIDEIRPAFIHVNPVTIPPQLAGAPVEFPPYDHDKKGRVKFPPIYHRPQGRLRLTFAAGRRGRRDQRLGEGVQVIGGVVHVRRDPQHRRRQFQRCPLHSGVGGHDPPLREQPGPHRCRVGAVDRRQGGDRARLVDRFDHPPTGHIGEYGPGDVAQLSQACPNSLRPARQMLTECDRKPHSRSYIGFAKSELLGHCQRRHPVWRGQPRT